MPGRDVRLELTWLGHSTTVITLGGTRVVTDPVLRRHNPPLRRRGPAPSPGAWAGAHGALLSHLHHDHADLPSLRRLAGVPVYTAPDNAAWLRRRGVDGVGLEEGEWVRLGARADARHDEDGVEVCLVRAVHGSRPMPHRPNAANGHLLRSRWGTVWYAGDTSLYDGIADLPRIAGTPIDLAVVPVGGWGARLSKGHMGPQEAADACAMVDAGAAVPVHWGTLYAPWLPKDVPRGWMDRPGPLFEAALAATAPRCTFLRTTPGGTVRVAAGSAGAGSSWGGPR